jgi:GAF domain-containing protein
VSGVVVVDDRSFRRTKEVLVHPLPETREALNALSVATDDRDADLVEEFDRAATTTQDIAPECVGLTLAFAPDDVSFTWVATDLEPEPVDATRCLAGSDRPGVCSTLSMPLVTGDRVYGELSLYGSTPSAFDGHHEELAALYGGWAGGAVANADLTFTTMARARSAPRVLADEVSRNVAVGLIMAAHDVPEATARHTLSDLAARAGVSAGRAADILLDTRLL